MVQLSSLLCTFALVFFVLLLAPCHSLNLSPLESALLKSRLVRIRNAVAQEYHSVAQENELDTYIFPGAGGVDELVFELQEVTPNSKIIDWTNHRGSIFTAAFDGEAVGEAISNLLPNRKFVHFIGISVGAFAANAAATTTYLNGSSDCSDVRLTLLDPFCNRGVFGYAYGREVFGKYATQSIQLMNTDDPVPTTNEPLPNCCCIDVTNASQRQNFVPLPGDSMHSWPVAYFARHYQKPSTLERGLVIRIDS